MFSRNARRTTPKADSQHGSAPIHIGAASKVLKGEDRFDYRELACGSEHVTFALVAGAASLRSGLCCWLLLLLLLPQIAGRDLCCCGLLLLCRQQLRMLRVSGPNCAVADGHGGAYSSDLLSTGSAADR